MKSLVAGWFSFVDGHATAGDLLARDTACQWLEGAGLSYDLALAAPFQGGVDWRQVDPIDYSHVLFVCGPFRFSAYELEFLDRFAACRLVGLNLSMFEPLSKWNPFDLLLERDSSESARADMAFGSPSPQMPIVGLCRVESYPGGRVKEANEAISWLVDSRPVACVPIDTRLDAHSNNPLNTPAEVELLISRMDVIITTRLHGLVLALKSGVPAIAIDPVPGGGKIVRQAELLGWPYRFLLDNCEEDALQAALEYCLTDAARAKARKCGDRGRELLGETFREFVATIQSGGQMEERYVRRLAARESQRKRRPRLRAAWSRFRDRLNGPWE